MIVLDASVVVELLLNRPIAEEVRRDLAARQPDILVPHLLDVEVVSALRQLLRTDADTHRHKKMLTGLAALPAERVPHAPLLPRVWELRQNFTAYDATYIALAEMAGAVLYTCDDKLRFGHRARVTVFQ